MVVHTLRGPDVVQTLYSVHVPKPLGTSLGGFVKGPIAEQLVELGFETRSPEQKGGFLRTLTHMW